MPSYAFLKKQFLPFSEAKIGVLTHALHYGTACFEGIRGNWNSEEKQLYIFRLKEHMQRLLDSLKIVRLHSLFRLEALVAGALAILRANQARQDTYLRPWSFISGIVYEQIAPADSPTETIIDTWPFESVMLSERGCRVGVSSWSRIGDGVMPPRVKAFSNYHNGRLAAMEAKASGYDWPLLLNERHKLTEGPGACVALVRGGKVITPDISSGLLESLTRDTFLRLLPDVLGIPVVAREVDRTELYVADEAFFMGTGWEVLPILAVDGLPVGNGQMGPVARAIDRVYHDVVRGIDPRYGEWRTPVWG